MSFNELFRKIASKIASLAGSPWAFIIAVLLILAWALSGPAFGYSNTWQLVINTSTTIITLLMVFLIQNTQNRDSKAIHLKLDELLKSIKRARNKLVNIEEVSDDVLEELHDQFRTLQNKYSTKHKETGSRKHKGLRDVLANMMGMIEKPLSEERKGAKKR